MQDYLIFLCGIIFSCVVNTIIVFQYMDDKFVRKYHSKIGYHFAHISAGLSLIMINLFSRPVVNLVSWIVILALMGTFLYTAANKSRTQRVIEIVTLFFLLTVCETVGYIILEFMIWKLKMRIIQPLILQSLRVTFSKLFVIIIYYAVIVNIWKTSFQKEFNRARYVVYGVIIVYSILNLSLILITVSDKKNISSGQMILLLFNMFGIVFVDLFFLYFTKFTEKNEELSLRLKLLEQQTTIQHNNYSMQQNKYNESLKILHDVNRHLHMIEKIYKAENARMAMEYTMDIESMLKPLIPKQYTDNPILNILLDDKEHFCAGHDIQFCLRIGHVDLKFMDAVEITTLFGNLLDNAIEACQKVKSNNKRIDMKVDTYNDFIAIQISNSIEKRTRWSEGKPKTEKKHGHGIGLVNVEQIIQKYDGNIMYDDRDGKFTCNIIFNG